MTTGPDRPEQDEVLDAEVVEPTAVELSAQPPPVVPAGDYTDAGVPSFDYVRDRIEGRYATSLGAGELPEEAATTNSLDEQMAKREQAGRDKLEEIRRAMRER
ncbi:MAG: hypothetical protein GEV28_29825 [Actinophytocola sp.]|uniref:hypothetical protein n=1 Tax=Actinophytocola sp. TaxID=1872138 RepID=UPI00132BF2BE|nr:hypothetical protein [Actinophytocola sp.]MPZ84367.1 hypothetical protein [Actinophytocola sp.]